jgi:tRNA-uridine 2-sulfurtransferase
MKKTVFVAMSGGVDSSVAAALMKKAGFNVIGVFMKPWQPKAGIFNKDSCLWKQDREDALRVAAKLDISFLTWDFSKEYEKYVAEYMIEGYKNGLTPNPDVMCNKFIKFGLFLDRALKSGADYIATGHYVKKVGNKLFKAKDSNKDQSYFLYTLNQENLKYCLFPVGDYKKTEIRKMAKKFGLPNWSKKDSQGICFVGPLQVKDFLKKNIRSRKGLVLRKSDGKILGKHDGAWFYTLGQRHGMGLSTGKPQYIVGKDVKNNILYVSDSPEIQNSKSKSLQIKDFNWINRKRNLPLDCKVKTRYRQKDLDCVILKNGSDKALVELKESNIPVAPGQAAVFYKRNEVLGGGIIV